MQSAKPSNNYGLKGLAPIRERDEARSADPRGDTGMKNKNPLYYQYRLKNEAKGYNADKENLKLPKINDKSYLQNRGAAILAAGNNKYTPVNSPSRSPSAIQQIYGGGNPSYAKPPVYNYRN